MRKGGKNIEVKKLNEETIRKTIKKKGEEGRKEKVRKETK